MISFAVSSIAGTVDIEGQVDCVGRIASTYKGHSRPA